MTPNWIIKNLEKHGNCALPSSYTKMDRKILIEKLSSEIGKPISINESVVIQDNGEKQTYLVAEVK